METECKVPNAYAPNADMISEDEHEVSPQKDVQKLMLSQEGKY